MEQDPSAYSQLRDFLVVLRRHKWSIALVTVITVGAALYFTSQQIPMYRTSAQVLVEPIRSSSAYPYVLDFVSSENESGIAGSVGVAERAAEIMGTPESPQALLGGLSVSADLQSDILTFVYTDPDPGHAAEAAQAFAEGYLEHRREKALSEVKEQEDELRKRLQDLERKLADLRQKISNTQDPNVLTALSGLQTSLATRYGGLQSQLDNLSSVSAGQDGGQILQDASEPRVPYSPNTRRSVMLALILGLGLGTGLAFGRERLDDRLRSRRDLEHLLDAPVFATIPKVPKPRGRAQVPKLVSVDAPRSNAAEAYRSLRTNVQYLNREKGTSVLTITSALIADGKTTTTANLAAALAAAGKKVIAVSCDLRKPSLHYYFDLDNKVGIADVLRGDVPLVGATRNTKLPGLKVIASGPIPEDPAELLTSSAMDRLLADLRGSADFVLLDTPPVMAVADASILGSKTDGIILVADASRATRGEVKHVRQELEQVGGVILGGVFNGYDPDRALYYSPEYRHKYTDYYQEPEGADEGKTKRRSGRRRSNESRSGEASPRPTDEEAVS